MAQQTVIIPGVGTYTGTNPGNLQKIGGSGSGSSGTDIEAINASGTPISINTGNSAEGLQSLGASISDSFSSLMSMINENSDKNNAWSAEQAQKQMDFQREQNQIAMDFNSLEAAKNRDWQEMMSNTAHQREIRDLQAAGLNPVLSASGGNGAAVTSGATASGVTSAGAKGDADQSRNAALAQMYGTLMNAQTSMYNANLSAKTNLAIADKQAAASAYAAQLAAETARTNNPWQLISTIADSFMSGSYSGNRGSGIGNLAAGTSQNLYNWYNNLMDYAENSNNPVVRAIANRHVGSWVYNRLRKK